MLARFTFIAKSFVLLLSLLFSGQVQADEQGAVNFETTFLSLGDVNESSGIAASWRTDRIFWTHNDSGDSSRIFSFDSTGKHLQTVKIAGAKHQDWEDMASFREKGTSYLVIADVGDNALRREDVVCYLVAEPSAGQDEAEVKRAWSIKYPDGPVDCEAIAVDLKERLILIVGKAKGPLAKVYSTPLDALDGKKVEVTARFVGAIGLPMVTGMDIHPNGNRFVVVTYTDAFFFDRKLTGDGSTDWKATLDQVPEVKRLPPRRQGEAICFDRSGDALWLTSEKKPTPLIRVVLP